MIANLFPVSFSPGDCRSPGGQRLTLLRTVSLATNTGVDTRQDSGEWWGWRRRSRPPRCCKQSGKTSWPRGFSSWPRGFLPGRLGKTCFKGTGRVWTNELLNRGMSFRLEEYPFEGGGYHRGSFKWWVSSAFSKARAASDREFELSPADFCTK